MTRTPPTTTATAAVTQAAVRVQIGRRWPPPPTPRAWHRLPATTAVAACLRIFLRALLLLSEVGETSLCHVMTGAVCRGPNQRPPVSSFCVCRSRKSSPRCTSVPNHSLLRCRAHLHPSHAFSSLRRDRFVSFSFCSYRSMLIIFYRRLLFVSPNSKNGGLRIGCCTSNVRSVFFFRHCVDARGRER